MSTLNSIIERCYTIQVGISCFQLPHIMQFLWYSENATDSQEMYKLIFWIRKIFGDIIKS